MDGRLRMRIVLVNRRLAGGAGGAERVLTLMANRWAARGARVAIVTFDDGRTRPFYPLASSIELVPLGVAGAAAGPVARLAAIGRRTTALRRALVRLRPQVVVSFQTNANVDTLLAAVGLRLPVIVSERNDPATLPLGGPLRPWLRDVAYPFAAAVVVQTAAARECFGPRIRRRVRVIPNPVPVPAAETGAPAPLARPTLVAMGRMTPQKGFDLLLESMARLKDRYPEWSLVVMGDGPLRSQLERHRDALGLSAQVRFAGIVRDPHRVLRQSDLFVLSSRYEGFPNSLCEAMACGLPVVATDCRNGPREIVRHGIDGLLVPGEDSEALAAAMSQLMSDRERRRQMGQRAVEITARYDAERILAAWDALVDECRR